MKEIIQKAKKLALEEIEKTGYPSVFNFDTSNEKGQEIAIKMGADKEIVILGTILMDLKLGECLIEGKLQQHSQRSAEATRKFLEENNIDEKVIKIVENCVAAHHKKIPYESLEAEICANADCYRFLSPQNIFHSFLSYLKESDLKSALNHIEEKMDEKWNILSLDMCKNELEKYYLDFKKLIEEAKN